MTDPLPFEREREITKKKELKLNGKKSRFQKDLLEKKEADAARQNFDQRAAEFMENRQQQQAEGVETAKKLIAMLRDKTIPQNKGVLSVGEEQEVRAEFNVLINSLNNDQSQPEGHGSLTAIALLVKTLFEMRDRMNILEYDLSVAKKKLQSRAADSGDSKNG